MSAGHNIVFRLAKTALLIKNKSDVDTGDVCCSVCNELMRYGEYTQLHVLIGDANLDGYVNIKDATAIQKHIAKVDMSLDIGKAIVI